MLNVSSLRQLVSLRKAFFFFFFFFFFFNFIADTPNWLINIKLTWKYFSSKEYRNQRFTVILFKNLEKLLGSLFRFLEELKNITGCKRMGYNIRQTVCLVFNPIMVDSYAFLFNCTAVGRVRLYDGADLNLKLESWCLTLCICFGLRGFLWL